MIAIIDYGMGNLRSVQKGLEKMGCQAILTNRAEDLRQADGIVLPGVGAFRDAMVNLNASGLVPVLKDEVAKGKPFLGICLGLHMLFESSEEGEPIPGLGLLQGTVKRLPGGVKIPHMGWNQIKISKPSPIIKGLKDGDMFYFVHSYYVDPIDADVVTTTTDYGIDFTSIVSKDNIFGIQFHPEKSSDLGLSILKNFGEMIEQC